MTPTNEARPARRRGRRVSVDAFRGVTIAGMILVNSLTEFDAVPEALRHAAWDGLHAADLVFPFFVFVMGVSIALSMGEVVDRGVPPRAFVPRIGRRFVLLVALGFLVNSYPTFHLAGMRLTGVLQRIAVVYVAAAAVYLGTKRDRTRLVVALALVVGTELVTRFVAAPGFAPGDRTPQGSLAVWIDHTILGARGHPEGVDPEGLLSTVPAIATALFGVVAGGWLRHQPDTGRSVALLVVAGLALAVLGLGLDPAIPINKTLWSATYVLATGGLAAIALAFFYGMIDIAGLRAPFYAFELLGRNAIAIYVAATLTITTMLMIVIGPEGAEETRTLRAWLEEHLAAALGDPTLASLSYGVGFLVIWIGVAFLLWRRRIFIKV